MRTLIVIAHPDDEILWFSSLLLRRTPEVVCVTMGRDKADRAYRKASFEEVMKISGVRNYQILDFPDREERLDLARLEKALAPYAAEDYEQVFTHGPFGETYNHVHHQDLCYMVHKLFDNVYCVAWNIYPDILHTLTPEEYDLKRYLIGTVYAREYDLLSDAYRIGAVEEFVRLHPDSVEVHYWAIANFGDHHELLGRKYEDFWGFKNSPYEIERHAAIVYLAKKTKARNILEFGACEGILTGKLSEFATVDCIEKAPVYQERLRYKGYRVLDRPETGEYDLSVVAAFLEYQHDPCTFLNGIESRFLIIDVILDSSLDLQLGDQLGKYQRIADIVIPARWERMYWDDKKGKMPVYKLGAHCHLYQKMK